MKKSVIILLHAGYWILYLVLLGFFMLMVAAASQMKEPDIFSAMFLRIVFAFAVVPGVISFYTFHSVLFSRFLKTKRIGALFLWGILTSVVSGCAGTLIIPLISRAPLFNEGYEPAVFIGCAASIIGLLNGGMGLLLKGFITWYEDIRIKEELNRRNYEMELALVKSNISPHFLFNTINNIDALITIDAAKASSFLNKLSDIMRFMLYETKTEKILLSRELSYIEKYIALQKIRTSNTDYVYYSVEGETADVLVEPLLFIPFIENAFKHADHKKKGNAIDVRIQVDATMIRLKCSNTYPPEPTQKAEYGGLGNELIIRRLVLLYPGTHHLRIRDEEGKYTVELELPLYKQLQGT